MPYFDIRVAVLILTFAAAGFAEPSQSSGDGSAAVTATDVLDRADVDATGTEGELAGTTDVVEIAISTADAADKTASTFSAAAWDTASLGAVDHDVFALALASAERAVARGEATPATLTVIDFSVPSTERRMFIYDLRSRELLFEEHVSHGRNSGANVPTMFSNQPESFKSSIGLYRTAEGYFGKHGYSLRLDGLEKGFNDRARERAIVIHGAEYVNGDTAKAQGRLGRSLGCPAVRPDIAAKVIDTVKDGGLVFAYYPDPAWLASSTYLN